MRIRTAAARETAELARIINEAFVVEAFFKIGERTSADEIAALMNAGGEFLVIDQPRTENPEPEPSTQNPEPRTLAGCVYLKSSGDRAYFGMLSIDPARQNRGLGRRLIDAVEGRARELGCRFMDIHIVNLRQDLPGYYRRFGYAESGTLPFSDPEHSTQPCFFIVMSKTL